MMLDLRTLQRALGGQISNGQLLCPGPGHSARDRSLAVRPSPDGFQVYSFAGDYWRDCQNYLRERLGLPPWRPGDEQDRRVPSSQIRAFDRAVVNAEAGESRPRTEDDLIRIERAVAIWNETREPRGTVAEKYLNARALDLPEDVAGRVLRFHPRCPWRDENTGRMIFIPCLVAAFRSIDDNTVTAVHRIRVDRSARWPKTDRRMLGVVRRAAVKLDAATDTLAIGEGVETCLAARQLGHRPAWALGSVSAISFLPALDGVRQLHILTEAGDASKYAAGLCARRWHRAGRKVQFVRPEDEHDDHNAVLMAMAAAFA